MWDVIFQAAVVTLNTGMTTAVTGGVTASIDRSNLTPSQRAALAEIDAIEEVEKIKREHRVTMREMAQRDRAVRQDMRETIERHRAQKADPTTTYLPGTILFRGD